MPIRLNVCQWKALTEKVGGGYTVNISGEPIHAATKDINICPAALKVLLCNRFLLLALYKPVPALTQLRERVASYACGSLDI